MLRSSSSSAFQQQTLELVSDPSSVTDAPAPAEENQPQSMTLPPPCFSVAGVLLGKHRVVFAPNRPFGIMFNRSMFSHMLLGDFKCVFAKFSRSWTFFPHKKRLPSCRCPCSPDMRRTREAVVTVTARTGQKVSDAAVRFLENSLTCFLLVFSYIFYRFLVMSLTVFTVFRVHTSAPSS